MRLNSIWNAASTPAPVAQETSAIKRTLCAAQNVRASSTDTCLADSKSALQPTSMIVAFELAKGTTLLSQSSSFSSVPAGVE